MSRKERKRLEAFSRVKLGGMTLVEASELLGLPQSAKRSGPMGSSQGQKPAANHPWRGWRPAASS